MLRRFDPVGQPGDRNSEGHIEQRERRAGEERHAVVGQVQLEPDRLEHRGYDITIRDVDGVDEAREDQHVPAQDRRWAFGYRRGRWWCCSNVRSGLSFDPCAPYRVRPITVMRRRRRAVACRRIAKNDMGESRNGIARPSAIRLSFAAWRASTTSSSARVPRAACWPIAFRPSGRDRVLVLEAGGIGRALLDQGADRLRLHVRRSCGQLEIPDARRAPASTGAACTGRAAAWSAARARSTPWCIAAACRRISTTGATSAMSGWGWDDVRPYFEKIRAPRRCRRAGRAATDRSTSRT